MLRKNKILAIALMLLMFLAVSWAVASASLRDYAIGVAFAAALLGAVLWPWEDPQDLVNPIHDL